ncbi:MAG TPA: integration host factor subunit alpha [Polyangiaceae bacterium]|nr:integration host factor subunit alpha [Polyangiaceae bacterium]
MARRPGATVTKADLAEVVHQRIGGFSKRQASELVNLVFETMKETLGRGEEVKISGYGNFSPRDKHERRGRNPRTGEAMPISERRVLTFKASKVLRAALNALAAVVRRGPPPSSPAPAAAGGGGRRP